MYVQFTSCVYRVLSDYFTIIQGFRQGYTLAMLISIIVAEVLAIFNDTDTRLNEIEIGSHEIKKVIFADDIAICCWHHFIYFIKIWLILNWCGKASSSKASFSKIHILCAGAYKNRTDKPRQMVLSQFSIQIVEEYFGNSVDDNRNWDKVYENLTKKTHIWNGM